MHFPLSALPPSTIPKRSYTEAFFSELKTVKRSLSLFFVASYSPWFFFPLLRLRLKTWTSEGPPPPCLFRASPPVILSLDAPTRPAGCLHPGCGALFAARVFFPLLLFCVFMLYGTHFGTYNEPGPREIADEVGSPSAWLNSARFFFDLLRPSYSPFLKFETLLASSQFC